MRTLEEKEFSPVNAGISPFVWGSILGVVGYTVSNKFDFHVAGFLVAGIGGGFTALLDTNGALQVINVAIFAEIVSRIQNNQYL